MVLVSPSSQRLKILLQYKRVYIFIFLTCLLLALLRINIQKKSRYNLHDTIVYGLISEINISGDKLKMTVKGREKIIVNYYLADENELKEFNKLKPGFKIKAFGVLKEPIHNTIPNTFDYYDYLLHHQIYYIMTAESIQVIDSKTSFIYTIKNALEDFIATKKSRDYLLTFTSGNKKYLDEEVMEKYQTLGISHIFAISGMHVSILVGILLFILDKFNVKSANIFIVIFLLLYLFITNFLASIVRSITIYIANLVNKYLELNIDIINIYYLGISLLLLINPFYLFDIGFIYSSVVSFSLVKYSHLIKGNYFFKLLKVSLIALLFSLPITIMINYEINILSILSNIVFVPIISIIIYPLSILVLFIPFFDELFFFLTRGLENLAVMIPSINVVIPKLNIFIICIYYLFLWVFFNTYNKTYLVYLLLILTSWKFKWILDDSYSIYFLDVGQGDSIVIRYKNETIMIDTGGLISFKEGWRVGSTFNVSDNTIKFLKSIGCEKLNYLIITHGDYDHAGDAINIVNNFSVDQIILNKGSINVLEEKIINTDVQVVKTYRGNMRIEFIDDKNIYDNENDNSQLISFQAYDYQMLLMGDASTTVEKKLIPQITKKYNLIKLGHHGSNTSSAQEFLKIINPEVAIISSGRNNRFNHPHQNVINDLKSLGIKYYNTQTSGTIYYKISPKRVTIFTFPP